MKGMIFQDGRFISVLVDVESDSMYGELPKHQKKVKESKEKKGKKENKIKKIFIKTDE